MRAFKGFNKDLKCRNFQFEIGGEYEGDKASLCNSGFHACEAPLDVFTYYPPADSRYCEVELDATDERHGDDTKVVGKRIKIGAELNLLGLVKAQVEWVKSKVDWDNAKESNTGDRSAATNTGFQSAATNTGFHSAAEVSGKDSVAIATGYNSRAKGALGCAIVAVERGKWNGTTHPLLAIKSAIVDGKRIKPDRWYKVKYGRFVLADKGE